MIQYTIYEQYDAGRDEAQKRVEPKTYWISYNCENIKLLPISCTLHNGQVLKRVCIILGARSVVWFVYLRSSKTQKPALKDCSISVITFYGKEITNLFNLKIDISNFYYSSLKFPERLLPKLNRSYSLSHFQILL